MRAFQYRCGIGLYQRINFIMPSSKKVRLNIEVPPQQRKILKILATEMNTSLSAISRIVFADYIKTCLKDPELTRQVKDQIRAYLRECVDE